MGEPNLILPSIRLFAVMSPPDLASGRPTGQCLPITGLVAVLHRKPLGVTLPAEIRRIAVVQEMPQFVNQDIVEVEISRCLFRPNQLPCTAVQLFPTTSVHPGLVVQDWFRRLGILFYQFGFNRVEIKGRTPLHPVTGCGLLSFASYCSIEPHPGH